MSSYLIKALVLSSVYLYAVSIVFTLIDPKLALKWPIFGVHISSVLIIFFLYLGSLDIKHLIKRAGKDEFPPVVFLLIVVEFANFYLLQNYPFVSLSDELRDGGLYAQEIINGSISNIFGYGAYSAHGLIIPTLTSFFYFATGPSVLAYRIPAATLATVDVLLIYILVRIAIDKRTAFWSALVTASLPLHMFFARTQVVVAFNFFWASSILLAFYILSRRLRQIDYAFCSLLIGFSFGFHAAIRGFSLLILASLIALTIMRFWKSSSELFKHITLVVVFVLIGFGPRILFTTPDTFFHTTRVANPTLQTIGQKVEYLKQNYLKSLASYVYEPVVFFYPESKPLFTPLLSVFFIAGVGYTLFIARRRFLNFLIGILLILPFFNSALTDYVNADHRLSPVFSIASILAGVGVVYVLDLFKNKKIRLVVAVLIALYLLYQILAFFIYQPANQRYALKDYLLMNSLYLAQNEKSLAASQKLCFKMQPATSIGTDASTIEQLMYLFPGKIANFSPALDLLENEAEVLAGGCNRDFKARQAHVVNCYESSLNCPPNYKGKIIIYY